MSWTPVLQVLAGTTDITDYVSSLDFAFGAGILRNRDSWRQYKSGGSMTLLNRNGYWSDASLAALDAITVNIDSALAFKCRAGEYTSNAARRTAQVRLDGFNAALYDNQMEMDTSATTSEADLAAFSSFTVTPYPAFFGYKADAGEHWVGREYDYLKALADFAGGIAFEDRNGDVGIYVFESDTRVGSFILSPASHVYELRGMERRLHDSWRRDAQRATTLNTTLKSYTATIPADTDWDEIGYYIHDRGKGRYELYVDLIDLAGQSSKRDDFVYFDQDVVNEDWPSGFDVKGSANDLDWASDVDGKPGAIRFRVNVDNEASATAADFEFTEDFDIAVYFYVLSGDAKYVETTYINDTDMDGVSTLGYLPDMPFLLDETSQTLMDDKLIAWSSKTPRVTRMVFPVRQRTQAAWQQLQNMTLGSPVQIFSGVSGAAFNEIGTPLYRRYRFARGRGQTPTCEIHFLCYRDASADFELAWEAADQKIFWEAADQQILWRT